MVFLKYMPKRLIAQLVAPVSCGRGSRVIVNVTGGDESS